MTIITCTGNEIVECRLCKKQGKIVKVPRKYAYKVNDLSGYFCRSCVDKMKMQERFLQYLGEIREVDI